MKILDLFCGAGGASMGYHWAYPDAEIVGVDNNPQPNYPFTFIQADATALTTYDDYDLIHASPPCQSYSALKSSPGNIERGDEWVLPFVRQILDGYGGPYVIENVPGAPLHDPVRLCGSQFRTLRTLWNGKWYGLRRHRLFETNFPVQQYSCDHRMPVLGVYGDLSKNPRPSNRGTKAGVRQAKELMGIDWMTQKELVQAVPPLYTWRIAARSDDDERGTT